MKIRMDGWMKSHTFKNWFSAFDDYVSEFDNRHVALLLDKASCHKVSKMELQLRNVEVFYLPPNTTSLSQPKDAGIIASLKRRFLRKQVSHALH